MNVSLILYGSSTATFRSFDLFRVFLYRCSVTFVPCRVDSDAQELQDTLARVARQVLQREVALRQVGRGDQVCHPTILLVCVILLGGAIGVVHG